MTRNLSAIASTLKIPALLVACLAIVLPKPPAAKAEGRWQRSYAAGYIDERGAFAGGSEIMHLVSHQGALYAANGYWVDSHWGIPPDGQKQSAQVLRLGAAGGQWQVDLEMGDANDHGLQYMKGNILKSATFTCDADGKPLNKPRNLLVMAAGANFDRGGAVSAWVRDDVTGDWAHTLVRHGSSAGGVRWVPRDMEVYRDKVTGVEQLFLLLGNPGVATGVFDPSAQGKIRWNRHTEFPFLTHGSFKTRPLGITVANGSLLFSVGGSIYRRVDGKRPKYVEVLNFGDDTDTDVGGIRGLTTIDNPGGKGDSILLLWAPGGRSISQVKRLDPDGNGGYTVHDEANMRDLMSETLGVKVTYTLGAHNMMYPVTHPTTGKRVHIIGFQGNIIGNDRLRWKGSALYAGAMYAVRSADGSYAVQEVNNRWRPGKQVLVSPRAFCLSPFGDGDLYVGGHDSSNKVSDNMAWVFHAPLEVALGLEPGKDAPPPKPTIAPDQRLTEGPIYELRIYIASDGGLPNLVKRFREHTDPLFREHNMQPVGYWLPTDPPASRKTFVYILQHPSRYEAWRNWTKFSDDRRWKRVLDQPQFKGLLSGRPTSIFMNATDYSDAARGDIEKPGGIYELRMCKSAEGKLAALNEHFREQTTKLFQKHDINNVGYWTAFDRPEADRTLIYLLHHASRERAEANWKALLADPSWRDEDSLLSNPAQRTYLKALEFSPLK